MKIAKKILKIAAFVVLSVLLLYLLLNAVFNVMYYEFYTNAESHGKIYGISDGFVQQGLDVLEDGRFIASGYMKKDGPSRIYISEGKKSTYTELFNNDGSDYTAHAGGVTHSGDYVYIAGSNGFDAFLLSDVLDGNGATLVGTVESLNDPAWCTTWNGYIFAGSFADPDIDKYPPEESETMTTPAGDVNVSLITVFKLDPDAELGIDPVPVAAISSANKIQGACFTEEGNIILSTSYGLASSVFYFHSVTNTDSQCTIEIGGNTLPLWYLDSDSLTKELKAPPMAEEIIIHEGRMYIMNESASAKYIFGKFIKGGKFYSIEIKDEYFE